MAAQAVGFDELAELIGFVDGHGGGEGLTKKSLGVASRFGSQLPNSFGFQKPKNYSAAASVVASSAGASVASSAAAGAGVLAASKAAAF